MAVSGLHERKDSRPSQRVPTTGRATTIHQRNVDQIDEAAVAGGPAGLRHLDRGGGDRGGGHAETAAGDGQRPATVDAAGIDEFLKRCVERCFRVHVRFRPSLRGRARSWKTVDADVEDLWSRRAEAGIEHEVKVRTHRGAACRQIVDSDEREARLVRRALGALDESVFDDRGAEAACLRPRRRAPGLLATDPIRLGQNLDGEIAEFRLVRVLKKQRDQAGIGIWEKSYRPQRGLPEIAEPNIQNAAGR